MKSKKSGTLLIELSVLIICSTILFVAVSKTISNQNHAINQMAENNNVTMILDSISAKLKFDLNSGYRFDDLDISQYEQMLKNCNYKLLIKNDDDRIKILLGVTRKEYFGHQTYEKFVKVYKKEVLLNE